ncbi:hypothetical protein [Flagellimonas halotolerans]|uniref:Uncharacterized protein n=1 Tax=Flagellimonas halotolerans TaxID=3112164 RepID=A0ABU6IUZ4_9FLAO|nr:MULTISPECIES: hypothetical protein [unclassified Allomuricauda]MEC3966794.1 hypothetical protein [Muricauda sp. SYSU M86414]MEC4266690.1 hypothetical protein [Muricauda sp. SYSU M84420]
MESIKKIWTNPLLHFNSELLKVELNTGEILKTETKNYEGIEFILVPHSPQKSEEGTERLEIRFKPHYWFNNDQHNANDFTPYQAIDTIQRFISLFHIHHLEHFKVVNLEYGLNFILDGYGKELISFPIYHIKNEFNRDKENYYSKKAYSVNKKGKANDKYLLLKFYSKGFQYPEYCHEDTLRFEVKTKRSKRINPLGIFHLGDLLNIEPYYKMKADIIANARMVLIIDTEPSLNNLNNREANKLKEYSNSSFWFNTLNQKRPSAFYEKKKTYLSYLDKSGNNLNKKLIESIEDKLNTLFDENRMISAPLTKNENRIVSPMLKGEIIPVSHSRICPITGLSLEHEKEGAKYALTTTFKQLRKNNPEKFAEVCSILLSRTNGTRPKHNPNIISHLAKQVRNGITNSNQSRQIGYNKKKPPNNQLGIFPSEESSD